MKNREFAERIKIFRKHLGFTQEAIASKAGINEKYYGRIERGESSPTIDCIMKLCDAMGIDVAELFLVEKTNCDRSFKRTPKVTNIMIKALKKDIDIHFNRCSLLTGCENCIWYDGYIGSMSFNKYELKISVTGNVQGILFQEYKAVLELNGNSGANKLRNYVKNDKELFALAEYMAFDEGVLRERKGNAFFITEMNRITAVLMNNSTGEIMKDDYVFERDNILEPFGNDKLIFDYIF